MLRLLVLLVFLAYGVTASSQELDRVSSFESEEGSDSGDSDSDSGDSDSSDRDSGEERLKRQVPCTLVASDCKHNGVLDTISCKCVCVAWRNGTYCDEYNYGALLHKTLLFYDTQRSGDLPVNYTIPYRGDSAMGDVVVGGYYDAGDHMKFTATISYSMALLAWGMHCFRDGYDKAGAFPHALANLKWGSDYLLKANISLVDIVLEVGNLTLDHKYWGRPEDMNMPRPATNSTGCKADAEGMLMAAGLAAASVVFKNIDAAYSTKLLDHAKMIYTAFMAKLGVYSTKCVDQYKFKKYKDKVVWAEIWLFRASGETAYRKAAKAHYIEYNLKGRQPHFSWANVRAGVKLLLHNITNGKGSYGKHFKKFMRYWLPGGGIHYTPKGLAWGANWAPLRLSANSAFLAMMSGKMGLGPSTFQDFAKAQIGYMLGDTGRSYVTGFGINPPVRAHHRSSSCPSPPDKCNWATFRAPGPNYHILQGALVGGPYQNDTYFDDRKDYRSNEVSIEFNAGFQTAIAAMLSTMP